MQSSYWDLDWIYQSDLKVFRANESCKRNYLTIDIVTDNIVTDNIVTDAATAKSSVSPLEELLLLWLLPLETFVSLVTTELGSLFFRVLFPVFPLLFPLLFPLVES